MENKFIRRVKHLYNNPTLIFGKLICRILPPYLIPDSLLIKVQFESYFGYPLDLNNPKTFNEKIQWLKINYRNPLMTILADKYKAKEWITTNLGSEYVIPTIGIWKSSKKMAHLQNRGYKYL